MFYFLFNTSNNTIRFCYNITGQTQESEGFYKPVRIKEVHSKLNLIQASLCTLTATQPLIYVCKYNRLCVPLGCLINGCAIRNSRETPGIEPLTSGVTSVYKPVALPPEPLPTKTGI